MAAVLSASTWAGVPPDGAINGTLQGGRVPRRTAKAVLPRIADCGSAHMGCAPGMQAFPPSPSSAGQAINGLLEAGDCIPGVLEDPSYASQP